MKSILYVHHVSNIGGGSFCLLNILKEVDRNLYKPIVLLKKDGPLVTEIKRLNIEVHFLSSLSTVPYNTSTLTVNSIINAFQIIYSFIGFKNLLTKIKPDLVYLNNMMLYPYLRIAKSMRIKTLIHIREHWPENEHKIQRKIAIDHIKKYSDQIVAINKFSSSMISHCNSKNVIVYDWIDFKDRDDDCKMSDILGEDTSNLNIYLFTGGLQPIKGTLEIIEVFSKILTSSFDRLLILGINKKSLNKGWKSFLRVILAKFGYKTYTFKVFEALNADNRIVCIPGTYKIKPIFQQSFCYLSYFTVPHANLALAESVLLHLPAIAASTPESLEYSGNGELAILFEMNNKNDFIDKLMSFQHNRAKLKSKLNKESHVVGKLFDKQKNVQCLNDVYKYLFS